MLDECKTMSRLRFTYWTIICILAHNLGDAAKAKPYLTLWLSLIFAVESLPPWDFPHCLCFPMASSRTIIVPTFAASRRFTQASKSFASRHVTWRQVYYMSLFPVESVGSMRVARSSQIMPLDADEGVNICWNPLWLKHFCGGVKECFVLLFYNDAAFRSNRKVSKKQKLRRKIDNFHIQSFHVATVIRKRLNWAFQTNYSWGKRWNILSFIFILYFLIKSKEIIKWQQS